MWGSRFERFFFDVRVFNPFAPSNSHGPLADTYRKHEADKRRLYGERVQDVEQATFIPQLRGAWASLQDHFIEGWLVF